MINLHSLKYLYHDVRWGVWQKIDSSFFGFLTYYFSVLKTSLSLGYQKINDILYN